MLLNNRHKVFCINVISFSTAWENIDSHWFNIMYIVFTFIFIMQSQNEKLPIKLLRPYWKIFFMPRLFVTALITVIIHLNKNHFWWVSSRIFTVDKIGTHDTLHRNMTCNSTFVFISKYYKILIKFFTRSFLS